MNNSYEGGTRMRASSSPSRRHAHHADSLRTPRRALTLAVAFALLVGVWLGASGNFGRAGTPSANKVSLNLLGSSSDPNATTTTLAPPPPDPTVPAPTGYADQLDALYGKIYTAATTVSLPNTSQQPMITPDQFSTDVATLSPAELNMIYTGTQSVPNFGQLSSTFTQADAVATQAVRMFHINRAQLSREIITRSAQSSIRHGHFVAPPTTVPLSLTNYQATQAVIIYPPVSCPDGSPGINYGETAIFALQVAADVVAEVVAVIPDGLSTAFGNVTLPNIARIIIAAIQLGVLITHDTFGYLQSVSNDCNGVYLANLAGNTDNGVFQTFQELTSVAGTVNEIDTNLANLTNQVTSQFDQQLTLTIQQALAQPVGSVPMAALELPASYSGYLDATPVGVNEVVSDTITEIQAAGQPLSSLAIRDETMAEQALGDHQYKLAFDYFRLAYQAAAG